MAGKVGDLTAKQTDAAIALAGGATTEVAAAVAGVQPRTVWKWKAEHPAFKAKLSELESTALENTAQLLVYAATDAVKVLQDIANDKAVKESVRVQAAKAILESMVKYRDIVDIDQRLRALEERLST